MTKRTIIPLLIAALVALLLPWLTVTFVRGDGGMAVIFLLRMLVKWLMDRRLARRGMPTEASAYVERKEALQRERAPEKEPEAERK